MEPSQPEAEGREGEPAGRVWSRGGVFKASSTACAKVLRHKVEEIRIVCTWDKLMDIYRASWKLKGKIKAPGGPGRGP